MNGKGITIAGSIIMDIGYMIDYYPEKEMLTRIYDPLYHTGGVNNLLIDLARIDPSLPLKVGGLIGEDENGNRILEVLAKYPNIDSSGIFKKGRTALTYAMTEIATKKRTFFSDMGNSTDYDIEHVDLEKLNSDIFHLEYLTVLGKLDEEDTEYGTRAARLLSMLQEKGIKTSIDMVTDFDRSKYPKIVWPALRYTDICTINESEAEGVVQESIRDEGGEVSDEKALKALDRLKELGVKKWAVIHSPKCGYGLDCETGQKFTVPSLKLPKSFIKATTGAGDAFCSGILYAAYYGLGLSEGLALGAKIAACSLSAEDSNSGVVELSRMNEVLAGLI